MMVYTNKNKFIKKSILCITTFFVASCSQFHHEAEPLPKLEACHQLQELISDHSENFIHFRKNKRTYRGFSAWTGIKAFPTASDCQMISWSSNLINYYCTWDFGKDMRRAKSYHSENVTKISHCLENNWQSTSKTTKTGGIHTLFSNSKIKTEIHLRTFKEQNTPFDKWSTNIIIGDKNNLNAKLQ